MRGRGRSNSQQRSAVSGRGRSQTRSSGRGSSQRDKSQDVCWKCQQKGHHAHECPNQSRSLSVRSKTPSVAGSVKSRTSSKSSRSRGSSRRSVNSARSSRSRSASSKASSRPKSPKKAKTFTSSRSREKTPLPSKERKQVKTSRTRRSSGSRSSRQHRTETRKSSRGRKQVRSSRDKSEEKEKDQDRVHSSRSSRPSFFRKKDVQRMFRVRNTRQGVQLKTFVNESRIGALWDSGAMSCLRPEESKDSGKNHKPSGVTGVGGYSLDAQRTQQGEIVMGEDENTPDEIKKICSGGTAINSGASHIWIGDECLLSTDMSEKDKEDLVRRFKKAAKKSGGKVIKMGLYEGTLPIIDEDDYEYLRTKMRLDDPTYHEDVANGQERCSIDKEWIEAASDAETASTRASGSAAGERRPKVNPYVQKPHWTLVHGLTTYDPRELEIPYPPYEGAKAQECRMCGWVGFRALGYTTCLECGGNCLALYDVESDSSDDESRDSTLGGDDSSPDGDVGVRFHGVAKEYTRISTDEEPVGAVTFGDAATDLDGVVVEQNPVTKIEAYLEKSRGVNAEVTSVNFKYDFRQDCERKHEEIKPICSLVAYSLDENAE